MFRNAALNCLETQACALQFAGGDATLGQWKDADLRRDLELLKDAVLLSLRERSLRFVKGRGLQNTALEASHAIYRDAKILLDLSIRSRR